MSQLWSDSFEEIEALYTLHSRHVYAFALKILGNDNSEVAEDIVQEAFLRYWKKPNNFNAQQGPFINWFVVVVRNLCLDYLHRKSLVKFVSLSKEDPTSQIKSLINEKGPVEEEVWLQLQRSEIQTALKTITREQRLAIELAFFQGLTHSQIAFTTAEPLGTVKSRIRQGLLKLKVQLDIA